MKDRWVLVIGAGYWQIPLIETVQSLGYKAVAIDRDTSAPGRKIADMFEPVDITDIDGTISFGKKVGIAGAVSDQTDLSQPTLAAVCQELNLPGPTPEVAYNTTNKARMRELAGSAGLKNPRYIICGSVDEGLHTIDEVGFPCVVKPTDAQASRGVQLVERRKDLKDAIEEAFRFSREGRILVEEYIRGTEVTVEGCRYAGETHLLGVSAKSHTPPPHIIAVNLDFPAPFPEKTNMEIKETYEKIVDALGIVAGSIHGEMIVAEDGCYLIEIANRGGGSGTSSHVIPALSGVNLLEANVQYAVGAEIPVKRTMDRASVLRFLLFPSGTVAEIYGLEKARSIEGVVACDLYIKPGDVLKPPVMDTQRHGYIITAGAGLKDAQAIADEVENIIQVKIR